MSDLTVLQPFIPILILLHQVSSSSMFQNELDSERIVGGKPTTIEEYPYQISLERIGAHVCGGSILSKYLILTAAHCILGYPIDLLAVRAASSYIEIGGQLLKIRSGHIHPNFDMSTMDNDVAILLLQGPIEFSRSAKPIRLASADDPPLEGGEMAVVTGWGAVSFCHQWATEQLREVNVPIMKKEWCIYCYFFWLVTDSMICAGYPYGTRGPCTGDSGGPLVLNNKQIGVVSWSIGCGLPDNPGVYAYVSYLRSFIDEIAKAHGVTLAV